MSKIILENKEDGYLLLNKFKLHGNLHIDYTDHISKDSYKSTWEEAYKISPHDLHYSPEYHFLRRKLELIGRVGWTPFKIIINVNVKHKEIKDFIRYLRELQSFEEVTVECILKNHSKEYKLIDCKFETEVRTFDNFDNFLVSITLEIQEK